MLEKVIYPTLEMHFYRLFGKFALEFVYVESRTQDEEE